MFSVVRTQPDRFVLQVVPCPNEAHRAALRPHEDGVGNSMRALCLHTAQERAVADSGCTKNDVLAVRQIIGKKDSVEIITVAIMVILVILFLLSPVADYITGTTVTIDGALSLTVAQGA